MRIALVVERFEPGAGGVENVAWQVAHGLARAGDEVHVVARRITHSHRIRAHPVTVPVTWQPARALAFSQAAARLAPRGRFDVVYSMTRTAHQDLYRAGSGSHADYLERRYRGAGASLRRLTPRHATLLAFDRRVFGDASQLVQCNSEMVRGQIERRYEVPPERLAVVRNGVDRSRYRPRPTVRATLRARHGVGAKPVWLFAGSGFARKGLDTALRALARSHEPGELWVVGSGGPSPWRRLAAKLGVIDRVRFLGFRRDLADLYAAADVLFLPTRYDAFANVCLEAAASGLASVTSGANGAAELFRCAGWVVEDPDDIDGFARALDAAADPGERARRAAAAEAVARAHDWDAHVAALRQLFARVGRVAGGRP